MGFPFQLQRGGIITAMNSPRTNAAPSGLFWLCVLLWVGGLFFTGAGILFLLRGAGWFGVLVLAIAGLMAASGYGLWRLRRWGVFLFGVLAMLGSINFLSNVLFRYSDLSQAATGTVLAAWVSLLAAVLTPVGLFYLVLVLWRRTH